MNVRLGDAIRMSNTHVLHNQPAEAVSNENERSVLLYRYESIRKSWEGSRG